MLRSTPLILVALLALLFVAPSPAAADELSELRRQALDLIQRIDALRARIADLEARVEALERGGGTTSNGGSSRIPDEPPASSGVEGVYVFDLAFQVELVLEVFAQDEGWSEREKEQNRGRIERTLRETFDGRDFEITLEEGGEMKMVVTNGSRVTRSRGRWSLDDTTLNLRIIYENRRRLSTAKNLEGQLIEGMILITMDDDLVVLAPR